MHGIIPAGNLACELGLAQSVEEIGDMPSRVQDGTNRVLLLRRHNHRILGALAYVAEHAVTPDTGS